MEAGIVVHRPSLKSKSSDQVLSRKFMATFNLNLFSCFGGEGMKTICGMAETPWETKVFIEHDIKTDPKEVFCNDIMRTGFLSRLMVVFSAYQSARAI
jgi:hypothetical protein